MTHVHNRTHTTLSAFAILVLLLLPAAAQDVTEPALKAAYVYTFAKFTEWPADALAAGAPMVFCVIGDRALGKELGQMVQGRTLEGHSLAVSMFDADTPSLIGCHIAYVSGVIAGQSAKVVARLRDAPVLTISDVERFTKLGGIAQFFFENGQLRFDVQLASVKRARLQISSRLLMLARAPK